MLLCLGDIYCLVILSLNLVIPFSFPPGELLESVRTLLQGLRVSRGRVHPGAHARGSGSGHRGSRLSQSPDGGTAVQEGRGVLSHFLLEGG